MFNVDRKLIIESGGADSILVKHLDGIFTLEELQLRFFNEFKQNELIVIHANHLSLDACCISIKESWKSGLPVSALIDDRYAVYGKFICLKGVSPIAGQFRYEGFNYSDLMAFSCNLRLTDFANLILNHANSMRSIINQANKITGNLNTLSAYEGFK